MEISTIIGIIIFIVLVVLILKFIKNTVKAVMSIISLIFIFLLLGGAVLYMDVSGFRENFGTTPNIYLLEKEGKIITGVSGLFLKDKDPHYLDKDELSSYQQNYEQGNLKEIKGEAYKIFIIKSGVFDSVKEVIANDERLSKEEIFSLLESSTTVNDYLEMKGISIDQRGSLLDSLELKDSAQFKGLLFSLLFGTAVKDNGPLFIFSQYKSGNIEIYPETMLFKILNIVPSSLSSRFIKLDSGE